MILDETDQIAQEDVELSFVQKALEYPDHLAVTVIFAEADTSAKNAKLEANL